MGSLSGTDGKEKAGMTEGRKGQKSDVRDRMSEGQEEGTEVGCQRSDVRRARARDRSHK